MKIMILAPYIYDKNMSEFSVNRTGFGIMVNEIVKSIAETEEVGLLTRVITTGNTKHDGKYKLLSHTWIQIVASAKLSDWCKSIKIFFVTNTRLKDRLRKMFYCLDRGYIRKKIKTSNPDIVHIHGIGSITKTYIEICEEIQQKYVVTLHGLIGLNDYLKVSEEDREMEREFLQYADKNNIPISVISSGMKTRIEKNYLKKEGFNITVIPNGTKKFLDNKFELFQNDDNLIEERFYYQYNNCLKQPNLYPEIGVIYNYLKKSKKNGKKVLFFVGNITHNKNQIQAVKVLKNDKIFKNVILVLWGREVDGGNVRRKIIEYKLGNRVILGGFNNQMSNFWRLCDINLFLSLNDGFGLPIIEGYMEGIPCVTFGDLDATDDVYYPDAMLKIGDRSIESVTSTLKEALDKKWNHKKIIEIGNRFSIETMVALYLNWYKDNE